MVEEIINEEQIDNDFSINTVSIFALEEELRNFARKGAKYYRKASQANKKLAKMYLLVEITTASIIKKICDEAETNGKPIPPSAIGDLRKTKVPLYKEYQLVKKSLYEAQEQTDFWSGLARSWESRGYRLQELARLSERTMFDEPRVFSKSFISEEEKADISGGKLEID